MVGGRIGGVNVFGGGLALYERRATLVGAIGVSGDTSCADHNIAWRTRNSLNLDYVPGRRQRRPARVRTTSSTTLRRKGVRCPESARTDGRTLCCAAGTAIRPSRFPSFNPEMYQKEGAGGRPPCSVGDQQRIS